MKKILAIDDDSLNLELFQAIFSEIKDTELRCVVSGQEALAILNSFLPQYIILDIMMPKMDGLEVCRRIRKMDLDRQPKIIVVTGKVDDGVEKESYEAGCDDFLSKPFDMESLLKTLGLN